VKRFLITVGDLLFSLLLGIAFVLFKILDMLEGRQD
jgi:hypothetical protein